MDWTYDSMDLSSTLPVLDVSPADTVDGIQVQEVTSFYITIPFRENKHTPRVVDKSVSFDVKVETQDGETMAGVKVIGNRGDFRRVYLLFELAR